MILSRNTRAQEAWLADRALSACHPSLILQHISEGGLKLTTRAEARPGGGQYVLATAAETRTITLEVAIREALDFSIRAEAYQALCAWARSPGWLQLSDHPDQEIYVQCSKLPDLGRLREWTRELTLDLTAYWVPYWLSRSPTSVSGSGASGSLSLPVIGTTRTVLDAEITPTGGALSSLTLSTPYSSMSLAFSDAIASGVTVQISHDAYGLLHIRSGTSGTAELMRAVIPSTDDELYLEPGQNTITWSAPVACSVNFAARGAWL